MSHTRTCSHPSCRKQFTCESSKQIYCSKKCRADELNGRTRTRDKETTKRAKAVRGKKRPESDSWGAWCDYGGYCW